MQEIDEGNQVIYDAAGEEANVIFGWVSKEEMNDNVSYTVIATGFGSDDKKPSKILQEQKETSKENKFSGYSIENIEIPTEAQELDTPTIFRVKGSNKILSEESIVPNGGFKLDQLDAFSSNTEVEEVTEQKKSRGGSSFLRMMMD